MRQNDPVRPEAESRAYLVISSPIGPIGIESADDAITQIVFRAKGESRNLSRGDIAHEAHRQLDEYFGGRRTTFELPLAPRGTAFQQDVWSALRRIPYGDTVSYAELAKTIGRPAAVRAVGAANGQNPIPIVIPCHRVIGTDGKLVGFGGGLDAKRYLLGLERGSLF